MDTSLCLVASVIMELRKDENSSRGTLLADLSRRTKIKELALRSILIKLEVQGFARREMTNDVCGDFWKLVDGVKVEGDISITRPSRMLLKLES